MEQRVRFGVCVSCGRFVGIRQSNCPYCAEWVYLPRWFRWGRAGVCAAVLAGTVWTLLDGAEALLTQLAAFRGLAAYLVAAGVVALFYPESFERDVIVSVRDRLRSVCYALGISAFLLVSGLAGGWLWTLSDATIGECVASGLLLAGSVLGAQAYGVSISRIVGLACVACAWLLA